MRRLPPLQTDGRTTGAFLHSGKNCLRQAAGPQQCVPPIPPDGVMLRTMQSCWRKRGRDQTRVLGSNLETGIEGPIVCLGPLQPPKRLRLIARTDLDADTQFPVPLCCGHLTISIRDTRVDFRVDQARGRDEPVLRSARARQQGMYRGRSAENHTDRCAGQERR